jgi:hypothetical protein
MRPRQVSGQRQRLWRRRRETQPSTLPVTSQVHGRRFEAWYDKDLETRFGLESRYLQPILLLQTLHRGRFKIFLDLGMSAFEARSSPLLDPFAFVWPIPQGMIQKLGLLLENAAWASKSKQTLGLCKAEISGVLRLTSSLKSLLPGCTELQDPTKTRQNKMAMIPGLGQAVPNVN